MSLLQNISNWLLSKKESPLVPRKFFSWNELKTVLIIAYDNQLSELADFMNACQKDNIKTKVAIIYNGKPEQAPKPPFDYLLLDKKQFTFFGILQDSVLQNINQNTNDVLINLGQEDCVKSKSIAKLTKASCKIGNFQNPIFDISIDVDKTTNAYQFLKQVVVYLQMIKTK